MPGAEGPNKMPGKERRFITENIVRRPMTRGQLITRGLFFLFFAFLFGVIAAVSFVISSPFARRVFEPETETEPSLVFIPADETEEVTEAETTQAETSEMGTEPVEDLVEQAMASYHYTMDDLNALVANLRIQMQTADQSIVTVHSVQQETDWFDNPVEKAGLYAGAVIVDTETELLILTPLAAVEQADTIKVTFADGTVTDGSIKQVDTITKVAVVSVAKETLGESTLSVARPLPLGNSYLMREGDLLIAIGGAAGMVHSGDYGFVSYIYTNMQMVDRKARVLYSNIAADPARGTFFINTAGEMIGWAMEPVDEEEPDTQMTRIMGISDYKKILEDLSNGEGSPCIGIQGQIVSGAMQEEGIPLGIYVLNVVSDRPAYNAGIQNGDIITEINGHETISVNEFRNVMDGLKSGQNIKITVQRNGREEEYAKLEFDVTVGAR